MDWQYLTPFVQQPRQKRSSQGIQNRNYTALFTQQPGCRPAACNALQAGRQQSRIHCEPAQRRRYILPAPGQADRGWSVLQTSSRNNRLGMADIVGWQGQASWSNWLLRDGHPSEPQLGATSGKPGKVPCGPRLCWRKLDNYIATAPRSR